MHRIVDFRCTGSKHYSATMMYLREIQDRIKYCPTSLMRADGLPKVDASISQTPPRTRNMRNGCDTMLFAMELRENTRRRREELGAIHELRFNLDITECYTFLRLVLLNYPGILIRFFDFVLSVSDFLFFF